ncbi:hypothetical protein ABW21_db0209215 [Orbilia brochopaga]|nr:hypothetical protein ABW21_db0209215 [Drechslerella brochopaga]
MLNTPLPAPVHLLQNVRYLPVNSKVRVLGCIQDYDSASGTVTLYHRATTDIQGPVSTSRTYTLNVSIDLLLQAEVDETTKMLPPLPPLADEGAWVTVTGYTTAEGGMRAIAMVKETKVDLEAYERGVMALSRVREPPGVAVGEGQWGLV